MMVAAVGFGPLGLSWGGFSEFTAVDWNSVYIVAALGGKAPCGPVENQE